MYTKQTAGSSPIRNRNLPRAIPPTALTVYCGQQRLGYLVTRGRSIEAFNTDNESVGVFRSQHKAVAALPSSGGGR
jgi:hypothetical protein